MMELRAIEAEFKPKMHKALRFDGVDDCVVVYDSPSLRPSEFTIMAWFNAFSNMSVGRIVSKGAQTIDRQGYSIFWYGDTGRLVGRIFDTAGRIRDIGIPLPELRRWHFVAFTFKRPTLALYLNGELMATAEYNVDIQYGNIDLQIGRIRTGSQYWHGLIGSIYIYDIALSKSEIKHIYYNPFDPPEIEHLVLWLAPGSIDLANGKWWDLSGKGNHGTIYGCNEVKLVEPEVAVV